MNKYYISKDDCNSPINNKIDLYSTQHTLIDDIYMNYDTILYKVTHIQNCINDTIKI